MNEEKRTCTHCNSNNTNWLIDNDHECYDCGGIY